MPRSKRTKALLASKWALFVMLIVEGYSARAMPPFWAREAKQWLRYDRKVSLYTKGTANRSCTLAMTYNFCNVSLKATVPNIGKIEGCRKGDKNASKLARQRCNIGLIAFLTSILAACKQAAYPGNGSIWRKYRRVTAEESSIIFKCVYDPAMLMITNNTERKQHDEPVCEPKHINVI